MRLTDREREVIVDSIKHVDQDADIYLFGSRVDDHKRGGDIDILIFSEHIRKNNLIAIEEKIFKEIDEQKIDFVLSIKNISSKFIKMILSQKVINL
jgi:predicted nucleotidyltransferase